MKYIDLNTWPRKEHFQLYHSMDCPHFNVCMNLDITNFLRYVKKSKLSFYYAMCFAATQTANQIEELRYRIRGEEIVLHDRVHPSFTDLKKGEDLFHIVTVNMGEDLEEFVKDAAERSAKQVCFLDPAEQERDDLIYITCAPWFSFTQLTHPMSINRDDSIPRLSWGKYFEQNGKILLPFSIQANHAFMDGRHVGCYVEKLQNYLDSLISQ